MTSLVSAAFVSTNVGSLWTIDSLHLGGRNKNKSKANDVTRYGLKATGKSRRRTKQETSAWRDTAIKHSAIDNPHLSPIRTRQLITVPIPSVKWNRFQIVFVGGERNGKWIHLIEINLNQLCLHLGRCSQIENDMMATISEKGELYRFKMAAGRLTRDHVICLAKRACLH